MPYTTDKEKLGDPFLRRNTKLIDCQRAMVHYWYERGMSIHSISKLFRVNKRTIQFILFPERLKRNKELRKARGGEKQYYDKEKHSEYMKTHRQYKYKTLKK